jgi:hypothetical protein
VCLIVLFLVPTAYHPHMPAILVEDCCKIHRTIEARQYNFRGTAGTGKQIEPPPVVTRLASSTEDVRHVVFPWRW